MTPRERKFYRVQRYIDDLERGEEPSAIQEILSMILDLIKEEGEK